MNLTAFLDVAIGLVVIYLGASLLVTVINQWFAELGHWRRKVLQHSLNDLFNGNGFRRVVEDFPNIAPLHQFLQSNGAMLDPLTTMRMIASVADSGAVTGKATIDGIREGLDLLPDSRAKQAFFAIAHTSGGDVQFFLHESAAWMEHALADLGQKYQQRMKLCSFGVGLCIAMTANIDTLYITRHLYEDKAGREQMLAFAESISQTQSVQQLQNCSRLPSPGGNSISLGNSAVGTVSSNEAVEVAAGNAAGNSSANANTTANNTNVSNAPDPVACQAVRQLMQQIVHQTLPATIKNRNNPNATIEASSMVNIPIGWDGRKYALVDAWIHGSWTQWIGWLISAIAISFGAPFWFDLLNKLLSAKKALTPRPFAPTPPPSSDGEEA